jgi:hypothetical protein
MGLHFSLVDCLIMDLVNFWLPIITLFGVVHDLVGKCLIITLHLISLLKELGWGALYFCSGGSGGYKFTGFLLTPLVIVLQF